MPALRFEAGQPVRRLATARPRLTLRTAIFRGDGFASHHRRRRADLETAIRRRQPKIGNQLPYLRNGRRCFSPPGFFDLPIQRLSLSD